jgi:sugar lactone lactonase YvrE
MYYIDTPTYRLDAFDYDVDTGDVANRRTIMDFTGVIDGFPDGMTIDANGDLWVAFWDGHRVTCVGSDGTIKATVEVGAARTTSAIFGGDNFKTMYITAAAPDLENNPGAEYNNVFKVDVGIGGYPSYRFG